MYPARVEGNQRTFIGQPIVGRWLLVASHTGKSVAVLAYNAITDRLVRLPSMIGGKHPTGRRLGLEPRSATRPDLKRRQLGWAHAPRIAGHRTDSLNRIDAP